MNFFGFMNPTPQPQQQAPANIPRSNINRRNNNLSQTPQYQQPPQQYQQPPQQYQQPPQPPQPPQQYQQPPQTLNVNKNKNKNNNQQIVNYFRGNSVRPTSNNQRVNNFFTSQQQQQQSSFMNEGENEEISNEEEMIERESLQTNLMVQNKNKNKNKNKPILNVITNTLGITTPNLQRPVVNMNLSDSTKRHYFIGYVFNQKDIIDALMNVQSQLTKEYKLKDYYLNFNNKFMTRFIYLGYLTPEVANKYMENMVSPICNQLVKKIKPLKCRFTKIKPKFDKPVNWFSIFFEDENNFIKNVIIPFLDKEVIKPIFPKRYTNYQPLVDIIHFKGNTGITRGKNITVPVPHIQFTMDHLSLISAKPTQSKLGYQSIHDNLSYEEENKYYFPFNV
jgi:hypothetical protein